MNLWIAFFIFIATVAGTGLFFPLYFKPLLIIISAVSGSYILAQRALPPFLLRLIRSGVMKQYAEALLDLMICRDGGFYSELIEGGNADTIASLFVDTVKEEDGTTLIERLSSLEMTTKLVLVMVKKDELSREKMVSSGVVECLRDILSATSPDDFASDSKPVHKTIEYAMMCLYELAVKARFPPQTIAPSGIRVVLKIARRGTTICKEAAVRLLNGIANDPGRTSFLLDNGAVDVVKKSLENHESTIVRAHAALLSAVLASMSEKAQQLFVENGILSSLVACLGDGDKDVLKYASLALSLFATQKPLVKSLVELNAVPALVKLLLPSSDLAAAAYSSLSLFYLFLESDDAKIAAAVSGVSRALYEIFKHSSSDVKIKENSLRAIGAFAKSSDRVDFREDVVLAGWVENATQLFDVSTPATLRVHAAAFLQVLLTPTPGVPEAVRSTMKCSCSILGDKLRDLLKCDLAKPEVEAFCNLNNMLTVIE